MHNLIFLYYGFLAMLAQLVIFREMSVLFYGNELFLGTFLSSWLFWTGSGSFLARRLLKGRHSAAIYLSYAFLVLSLLLPAMILLIRLSKGAFASGEFIGPIGMVSYTFIVMSIISLVIGAQFSLSCAVAEARIKKEIALGRVYLCEALGAVMGGAAFTYILIGRAPTFAIAAALSFACILVSLALLIKIKNVSTAKILFIVAAMAVLTVNFKIEPMINKIEWKSYQFIEQKEARNDTLSLVNMGSIKNIFIDGMLSASFPSPEIYESAAHWPLLASADPERILIMQDTSLGVIKEALKYRPRHIDYVVLDRSFLDLVRPFLDSEDSLALKDKVTHIHYADPRIFIRNNKGKYDAVIINIPEVPNLKTNRFYTEEFYNNIKDALKPGGILAVSVASSENYLSRQTRLFNASVYSTLKTVFDTVEIIPGDTIIFLSSAAAIDMRKETILGRFNERELSNRYVIPSYIEYKLKIERRAGLKKLLEETSGVKINRDFRPMTCYYFAGLWLNKFSSPLGYAAAGILFICLAFIIFKKRKKLFFLSGKKESILIFVLGFIGIVLELILLLGYQVISGYVYWQMGILFASFMSGLFLGSSFANRLKDASRQKHFISLVILSLIIAALSVYAAYLLPRLIYLSTTQNILVFILLLSLAGLVVSTAFVIAGFLIREDEIIAKAGSLYAADLWGAALGAMLSTNLMVPIFGILGALNFSAVMGLAGLAVFLLLSRKVSL